jgi:Cu/Ag efflux pump CusA
MTEYFSRLQKAGGEDSAHESILRGAMERVSPVLMSALATSLALLPALFLGDIPGLETIQPMAIVVLGGAITTLVLDLFVLPALYLRYGLSQEADLELAPVLAATD